jgi:hypothetical protein
LLSPPAFSAALAALTAVRRHGRARTCKLGQHCCPKQVAKFSSSSQGGNAPKLSIFLAAYFSPADAGETSENSRAFKAQ